MSSIDGALASPLQPDQTKLRNTGKTADTYLKFDPDAPAEQVDTVEISDEARKMSEYKPLSPMNPKKVLVPGSAGEKTFRELMKSVKSQKSEIMTHIEDALKNAGLSLDDMDALKIEVDGSGKIVVGGMDDRDMARAVEDALNKDGTLSGKLRQFQRDEKDLSGQIMDYTGATLFELTMTEQGDINKRIQDAVPGKRDEYYWDLGFLGETRDTVVSRSDIDALGFAGKIDFSGEVDVNAKPEENIRETMDSLTGKINEAFDAHNAELAERLEASGGAADDAFRTNHFLDLANVTISVDNHGEVIIDGMLSADEETHKKGVKIIEKLVREMLNGTEENSYHLNLFTEASEILIRRKSGEAGFGKAPGALQGKVLAEIVHGAAGGIRIVMPGGAPGGERV